MVEWKEQECQPPDVYGSLGNPNKQTTVAIILNTHIAFLVIMKHHYTTVQGNKQRFKSWPAVTEDGRAGRDDILGPLDTPPASQEPQEKS